MPVIDEVTWSGDDRWLDIQRILFTSQASDNTTSVAFYTSSNPLNYDTSVDPGVGILKWNNVDPTLITQIAISTTDRDITDQTLAIADLKVGDEMTVRQDTGRFFTVKVTGVTTLSGWFQVGCTFDFAVGVIQNNKSLDVTFSYFPRVIPNEGDTLQIRMAQEWPWVVYRTFTQGSGIPESRGVIPISDIQLIEIE